MDMSIQDYLPSSPTALSLSALNLTGLSQEDLINLHMSHAGFKAAIDVTAKGILASSIHMFTMEKILGDKVFAFVQSEFGIDRRTAKRYLDTHTNLVKYVSVDGRIDMNEAVQYTQKALLMLNEDTSPEVISEMRSIAQSGTKVNAADVQALLDKQSNGYEMRLAAAESQISLATKSQQAATEKCELALSRVESTKRNSEENEKRLKSQIENYEEEIAKLKGQAVRIVDKEVPTVPEEFKSIEEAISVANSRLVQLQEKITTARGELAMTEAESAELNQALGHMKTTVDQLVKLRADVENLFSKLPLAQLRALSQSNPIAKEIIVGLGNELIARGQLLINMSEK